LSAAETEKAAAYNLRPGPVERAWDYWVRRLDEAEALIAAATPSKKPTLKHATTKPAGKRAAPARGSGKSKKKRAR